MVMTKRSSLVRLDQWLHAARFFKTRSIAAQAVKNGRILVNQSRAKPAQAAKVNDLMIIRRGHERLEITVLELSKRRGPATEAARLYAETEDSRERREIEKEKRRFQPHHSPGPERRPDKRSRRNLIRINRGD